VESGSDGHPAEPEDEPRVVALPVDDVLPLVGRITLEHELKAVVLVPARVVLLEAGELSDDPDAFETRLLRDLAQKPGLEVLVRIESACRNLQADVRMLRILEDQQLRLPVAHPRDVGDDAPALHPTSSSACAISPRRPSMRT
jgi:hypothetical protein